MIKVTKMNYENTTVDNSRYMQLLSRSFPSIADASVEIINLEAILNLPKGTEHFLSDIHGEYEAFRHVLRNASGAVRRKVDELFGTLLNESERKDLCSLIYYPSERITRVKNTDINLDEWYQIMLNRLIYVCRSISSKYTRSKVRKALPKSFSYIIQELLHESGQQDANKSAYVEKIIGTIIETRRGDHFIIAICNLIQRLIVDSLHIIGDIYDRGPAAHLIMDMLCDFHHVDIQWGNHDVLWIGAAAGNRCCIANAIRVAIRYNNLETLEEGYGINLFPLADLAAEVYADDPASRFISKMYSESDNLTDKRKSMQLARMHKAIAIIQFKLEAIMINRRPEFEMEDRMLLHRMNLEEGTLELDGQIYPLTDTMFPTIDPNDPYALTEQEWEVINKLRDGFLYSERLQKHINCMLSKGSLYLSCNSNLLYHASIPMNFDNTFREVNINGSLYKGKALLDHIEKLIHNLFRSNVSQEDRTLAEDYVWYLWCGKDSPLFDKSRMTTFERYFVNDKETHKEEKGAYYTLREKEEVCDMILDEFNVEGEHRHIINGHVPVLCLRGENPIKANGKLLVIDGGFSKPYHSQTGIAGYTLVYHSRGFQLVQHEPFESTEEAINQGLDIKSTTIVVELSRQRMFVKDTDMGKRIQLQIDDLCKLLVAYEEGIIKERK